MGLMGNYRTEAIGYYKAQEVSRRTAAIFWTWPPLRNNVAELWSLSRLEKELYCKVKDGGISNRGGKSPTKTQNPDPEQLLPPISRPSRNGNDKEPDRLPEKSRSEGVQLLDAMGKN